MLFIITIIIIFILFYFFFYFLHFSLLSPLTPLPTLTYPHHPRPSHTPIPSISFFYYFFSSFLFFLTGPPFMGSFFLNFFLTSPHSQGKKGRAPIPLFLSFFSFWENCVLGPTGPKN